MPNWVKNRLVVCGTQSQIDSVFSALINDENEVDFNRIIPMPQSLIVEDGSAGELGLAVLSHSLSESDLKKFHSYSQEEQDRCIRIGEQYIDNIKKYGYRSWYRWSIDNWGTKWNATDTCIYRDMVEFYTAWSCPIPIFEKLAEMFPDIVLKFCYADEDAGYNVGSGTMQVGEFSWNEEIGGSDEAFKIYFELWGGEDEWERVDGEWQLKEME